MQNLKEINIKISKIREKIKSLMQEKDSLISKLKETERQLIEIQNSLENRLQSKRNELISIAVKPLEENIKSLKAEIQQLRNKSFNLSDEEIKNKYVKDYYKLEKLDKLLDQIKSKLENKLNLNEVDNVEKLSAEDLRNKIPSLLKSYTKANRNIKNIDLIDFSKSHDIVELFLSPPTVLGETGVVIYIMYIVTIVFILIKNYYLVTLSSIIILLTIGIALFMNTSKLFKYYKDLTCIKNNIPKMFEILNKEVSDVRNEQIEQFNKDRDDQISILQNKILDIEKTIESNNDIQVSDKDKEGILVFIEIETKRLSELIINLKEKILDLEKEIGRLEKELHLLLQELDKAKSKIISYKVNDDNFLLPKDILINDNPVKSIELKRGLNMFAYDDISSYQSFVKLLVGQLLMSINPFCLHMTVFDTSTMGGDFLDFYINKDILEIIYNDSEISKKENEMLEDYHTNMEDLRGHKGIDSYNEYMIEIDSLTREYRLLIYVNPSEVRLKSESLKVIKNIAPLSGVIPVVFLDANKVYKDTETLNYITDLADSSYLIKDGDVLTKS